MGMAGRSRGRRGHAEQRAASDVVGGSGRHRVARWRIWHGRLEVALRAQGGDRIEGEAASGSRGGAQEAKGAGSRREAEQGRPGASRLGASDPGRRHSSEVSLGGIARR